MKLDAEDCVRLLAPLSAELVLHLIKLQPHRFPLPALLRLFDPNMPEVGTLEWGCTGYPVGFCRIPDILRFPLPALLRLFDPNMPEVGTRE